MKDLVYEEQRETLEECSPAEDQMGDMVNFGKALDDV